MRPCWQNDRKEAEEVIERVREKKRKRENKKRGEGREVNRGEQ